MPRKSETQKLYEGIIANPKALPADKLKAGELLDNYLRQRKAFRRHGRAKRMLGIGAKESKNSAAARIADEAPEHLKGTAFAREIWPTWEKSKRDFWLKVWALEK
jgi:hypothetical protein